MITFYIDTHFTNLVLALFKDGKLVEEKILEGMQHTENTIPLFERLLREHNLTVDDINEIIVINGPGSFTGVRIGVVLAKILAYTKKIPVKALSYLEAMALNYDKDVVIGLKDRNGVFVGEFNQEHKLIDDYYYLTNKELENYSKDIILNEDIDLMKIYQYMKTKESINPHLLKPLYIKKLELGGNKNA